MQTIVKAKYITVPQPTTSSWYSRLYLIIHKEVWQSIFCKFYNVLGYKLRFCGPVINSLYHPRTMFLKKPQLADAAKFLQTQHIHYTSDKIRTRKTRTANVSENILALAAH